MYYLHLSFKIKRFITENSFVISMLMMFSYLCLLRSDRLKREIKKTEIQLRRKKQRARKKLLCHLIHSLSSIMVCKLNQKLNNFLIIGETASHKKSIVNNQRFATNTFLTSSSIIKDRKTQQSFSEQDRVKLIIMFSVIINLIHPQTGSTSLK